MRAGSGVGKSKGLEEKGWRKEWGNIEDPGSVRNTEK